MSNAAKKLYPETKANVLANFICCALETGLNEHAAEMAGREMYYYFLKWYEDCCRAAAVDITRSFDAEAVDLEVKKDFRPDDDSGIWLDPSKN